MNLHQAQRYLILEFSIFQEPQLILTFKIVSVDMAEIYLRTERGSIQTVGSSHGPHIPSQDQSSTHPHPMPQGLGESRPHLARSLEELVGKMLGKEGKHEVGALGVRYELSPQQETLAQELSVWQLLLPWVGRRGNSVTATCLVLGTHQAMGVSRKPRAAWAEPEAEPLSCQSPLYFSTEVLAGLHG